MTAVDDDPSRYIPELNWNRVDREKDGCDYFYSFRFNRDLSGRILCYPNEVVKTKEEKKSYTATFRSEDRIVTPNVGKWIVRINSRNEDGNISKYTYKNNSSGSEEDVNDVAKTLANAFAAFSGVLLRNMKYNRGDEGREKLKDLLTSLKARNMS